MTISEVSALATLARQLCGNSFDADDLVQDTLERALRAQSRYVDRGNRTGYLATILRNRFRDQFRVMRRQTQPTNEIDRVPAPDPTELAAWEHVTPDQVSQALSQLDDSFRRVYELYARGRSYGDIARELGISINTVGTRLLRARAKLRGLLLC